MGRKFELCRLEVRGQRSEVRGPASYFTATPQGKLSVVTVGNVESAPVAGVIEYCDNVPSWLLVTNSQLSSPRIATAVGTRPVACALPAVKVPETVLMRNGAT